MPTVTVTTELTDSQAMALAQFVKRLTWSEMRACAVDDDETWVMKDAIQALQKSLADVSSYVLHKNYMTCLFCSLCSKPGIKLLMPAFRDSVPHIEILPGFQKPYLIYNVSLAGVDFKIPGIKGDPVAFTKHRNHL